MSIWLNNALCGWYPYVALTAFLLGSLLRFDYSQYTWRTGSSQLLRRKLDIGRPQRFRLDCAMTASWHLWCWMARSTGLRSSLGCSSS